MNSILINLHARFIDIARIELDIDRVNIISKYNLQGRNDKLLSTDPMNDTAQFKPAYTEAEKSDMSIHVQGHAADPVHGVIGFNSSTGGTTKPNNILGVVKEAARSLGGDYTAHNCYGVGSKECAEAGLLENGKPMTWEPVYKSEQDTTPTTQQNPSLCTNSSSTDKQKCNNTN